MQFTSFSLSIAASTMVVAPTILAGPIANGYGYESYPSFAPNQNVGDPYGNGYPSQYQYNPQYEGQNDKSGGLLRNLGSLTNDFGSTPSGGSLTNSLGSLTNLGGLTNGLGSLTNMGGLTSGLGGLGGILGGGSGSNGLLGGVPALGGLLGGGSKSGGYQRDASSSTGLLGGGLL